MTSRNSPPRSSLRPDTVARRLLQLIDEHGCPNSFGIQELDLVETALEIANLFRYRGDEVNHILYSRGYVAKFKKADRKNKLDPFANIVVDLVEAP